MADGDGGEGVALLHHVHAAAGGGGVVAGAGARSGHEAGVDGAGVPVVVAGDLGVPVVAALGLPGGAVAAGRGGGGRRRRPGWPGVGDAVGAHRGDQLAVVRLRRRVEAVRPRGAGAAEDLDLDAHSAFAVGAAGAVVAQGAAGGGERPELAEPVRLGVVDDLGFGADPYEVGGDGVEVGAAGRGLGGVPDGAGRGGGGVHGAADALRAEADGAGDVGGPGGAARPVRLDGPIRRARRRGVDAAARGRVLRVRVGGADGVVGRVDRDVHVEVAVRTEHEERARLAGVVEEVVGAGVEGGDGADLVDVGLVAGAQVGGGGGEGVGVEVVDRHVVGAGAGGHGVTPSSRGWMTSQWSRRAR